MATPASNHGFWSEPSPCRQPITFTGVVGVCADALFEANVSDATTTAPKHTSFMAYTPSSPESWQQIENGQWHKSYAIF
jgi:hypothetical protein